MATFGIHHLLVMKAGEYRWNLGWKGCLVRENETKGHAEVKVSHVMRTDVPVIDENSDVQRAVELMLSLSFECVAYCTVAGKSRVY